MYDKLCAVINDGLDGRKWSTKTISVDNTTTPWNWTFLPPSDISLTLACDRIRQEVQMLHGHMLMK